MLLSLALLPLAGPATPAEAQFQHVHIQLGGRPVGKGMAVSRGLDCYVLTAAHVVEHPEPILVVGDGRRTSPGSVSWFDTTADLATIHLQAPRAICGRDTFIPIAGLWDRVASHQTGYLRVRGEHGVQEDVPVRVGVRRHLRRVPQPRTDPPPAAPEARIRSLRPLSRIIEVQSLGAGTALGDGHSGSVLYVGGEPAGILVGVSTDGRSVGRVIPIDHANALLAHFLPLVQPEEEAARFDDVLAADILDKNLAYMETPAFCSRLMAMARWIADPKDFDSDAQRNSPGGGEEHDMSSWLIPDRVTVLRLERGQTRRQATTRIGRVPGSVTFNVPWSRAERAIDACVRSDAGKPHDMGLQSEMRRGDTSRDTRWELVRKGFMGFVHQPTVHVWLVRDGLPIAVRVWAWDS